MPDPLPAPRELWRDLGQAGVLAKLSPFEDTQPDPVPLAELLTSLDAAFPAGLVLSVCVQVATVIPLLRAVRGHSPLAADVLSRALQGNAVIALAATDAGLSGSALLDVRTELREAGDDVVLTGAKEWITNAVCCDYALVLARHSAARHFTSFSWVLVPVSSDGLPGSPLAVSC